MTLPDDAACRAALRRGSRSFALAALLLPGHVGRPAAALYAFCRAADDLIDLAPDPAAGLETVLARLDAAYAGRPSSAEDAAFADAVRRFRIPRAIPDALLDGFAADVAGRTYEDEAALGTYAMQVAGTVGLMMARIMGVSDPASLAAAAELGCAMQLTNIARDVAEDARAGRLYLPLAWLREAGIDPAGFLARPERSAALSSVVARLLAAAAGHYGLARPGFRALPPACRPAIRAASSIYAAIGAELARRGHDPFAGRATVSRPRQAALLLRAALPRPRPAQAAAMAPPHPLVLAAAAEPFPARPGFIARLDGRIGWTAELFSRLEGPGQA